MSWDNNTHITPGYHDPIGNLDYLLKIVDSFLIFNLGDNMNVSLPRFQDTPDCQNITGSPDKGGSNQINTLINAEMDVFDIFFSQCRQIQSNTWDIDIFLIPQFSPNNNLTLDLCIS